MCLTAVQPDWGYWACTCSDAARWSLDWPEPCNLESDYQSIDLARRTGQSILEIQSVQDYEDLEEMVQDWEGRQVWFGLPLVGRPSQIIRWHPTETSDEEKRMPASVQKLSLRGWEYPMFRDIYVNNELLSFQSERQVLRAVWLISQWAPGFQSCGGHAAELQLTPEQLSALRTDRGEILAAHYTVISPRNAFCQRGPRLCGRWTRVWQRQNLWGHDEYVLDVWERHHYRRLTLPRLRLCSRRFSLFTDSRSLSPDGHATPWKGATLWTSQFRVRTSRGCSRPGCATLKSRWLAMNRCAGSRNCGLKVAGGLQGEARA